MINTVDTKLFEDARDERRVDGLGAHHAPRHDAGLSPEAQLRDAAIALVDRIQGRAEVADLLQLSASLLEHAAYELARSEQGGQVSRIILISAEIERMARDAKAQ
ncbi:hypothetical protein [Salipiger sp. CCB-MM3]|uniref:hypothetical protein n=1 Tax=Salipiger sp. CCB-MM3 TaxID=1792508 RepID=UPI0012F84ED1|nr:hypothetical protein [Salipiger sp. CCB-MM3]